MQKMMGKVLFITAASLLLLPVFTSGGTTAAEMGEPAAHQVFLFEHTDYGGENMSFTYDNDVPDLTRWRLTTGSKWNDVISSLKVGMGTKVTLYQHVQYGGASISFEGDGESNRDVPNLHDLGWGDMVSSIKIRRTLNPGPTEVFLFEHENFDGAPLFLSIGRDIPDLRQWSISGSKTWNDRISSLKIGKDAMVYACTDINYGGPCVPFAADGQGRVSKGTLHTEGWGDKISSLKIRAHDWTPESEAAESTGGTGGSSGTEGTGGTAGGAGAGGTEGTEAAGENWSSRDPEPHQVILFEHINFGGAAMGYAYDSDVPDLTKILLPNSSRSWNDVISSLKVGKNTKIILYEHINYQQPLVEIQGDGSVIREYASLHGIGWGDKVSSFKVRMSDYYR